MNAHFKPLNLLPFFYVWLSAEVSFIVFVFCWPFNQTHFNVSEIWMQFFFLKFSFFCAFLGLNLQPDVLFFLFFFSFAYTFVQMFGRPAKWIYLLARIKEEISEAFNTRVRQNYYKIFLLAFFIWEQSGSLINCVLELNACCVRDFYNAFVR